jgi:hypothetical protein
MVVVMMLVIGGGVGSPSNSMQPFGLHVVPFGQHPPPTPLLHSTVSTIHWGGSDDDSTQLVEPVVPLQQTISELENWDEKHDIPTGQQMD